jgi:hypothetical protein
MVLTKMEFKKALFLVSDIIFEATNNYYLLKL